MAVAWRLAMLAALMVMALACGGSPMSAPTAPSAVPAPGPAPSPAPSPAPAPTPPASLFTIVLPVAPGDTATNFFGLAPFGIHFGGTGPGGHGLDGHPGWDVECRVGALVRAAADGVVQSVFSDSFMPSRFTIQIQHQGGGNYRTVYTNVESVAAGITANAAVTRGQALGSAGTQTAIVDRRATSYAMTHFQVDDFSRNEGSTNPNAVNPDTFLDPAGRGFFDAVWRTAAYHVELTEPFSGNPRSITFPITRTWTRESGSSASRFQLIRLDAASNVHTYVMYDAGGGVTERGSIAVFEPTGSQSSIDFKAESGAIRLGLIDIVGGTMRLDLAPAGAARPRDLGAASVYRTQ